MCWLARASQRRHELRRTHRARRRRAIGLVRQLFVESVLLGGRIRHCRTDDGVVGESHRWSAKLSDRRPGRIVLDLSSVDWRTASSRLRTRLWRSISVAGCGVPPGVSLRQRYSPIDALKQHGRPGRDGGGRTADLLVVAQVALSVDRARWSRKQDSSRTGRSRHSRRATSASRASASCWPGSTVSGRSTDCRSRVRTRCTSELRHTRDRVPPNPACGQRGRTSPGMVTPVSNLRDGIHRSAVSGTRASPRRASTANAKVCARLVRRLREYSR